MKSGPHGPSMTFAGAESPADSVRPDWQLDLPSPDYFAVDEEVWRQLCVCLATRQNVLLIGPSGCGKTELCRYVVEAAGRELCRFNLGAMSEPRSSLIGNTHFTRERGTYFQKSRFVKAIETPDAAILLDEISRCGRDAFNILLPVLDHQQYLALDESEHADVVTCADGLSFLATANVGAEYTGASDIDQALLDRFVSVIRLDFPSPEAEARVLMHRCGNLGKSDVAALLKIANEQRRMAREGEFIGMISTRSLIAAGCQIAQGISVREAVTYCIANRFSTAGGDASERTRVNQLAVRFAG